MWDWSPVHALLMWATRWCALTLTAIKSNCSSAVKCPSTNLVWTSSYTAINKPDVSPSPPMWQKGVEHGLFQFIAVGTPPDEDGSADLQYVLAVAAGIGQHMNSYKVIIDKSTVPVGTADKVRARIEEVLKARSQSGIEFDVVSNPEFLKEGMRLTTS